MDRRLLLPPPHDPDLGFRWAMYALLAAAMAVRFGPAVRNLMP
jgi:hypothetical protein